MKQRENKAPIYLAFILVFLLLASGCAQQFCTHDYGTLQQAVPASFFGVGSTAHYRCLSCGKCFDEQKAELDTVAIPKLSTDLSVCINGSPTALTLTAQDSAHIAWTLENLPVKKGDVVTVCDTANRELVYAYSGEGDLDEDGRISHSGQKATVSLVAAPEGLTLSIQIVKHPGIVAQINDEEYPMHCVRSYDSDGDTYVYGYVQLQAGDRFVIVDNVNEVTYSYDDLAQDQAWNIYDYHRGENGEFVIDCDARYTLQFSKGGNERVYVTKAFAPTDGDTYRIRFRDDSQKPVSMADNLFTPDSPLFKEFARFAVGEHTENGSDIAGAITEKGLHAYSAVLFLEAGTQFYIESTADTAVIAGDRLSEAVDAAGCFHVNEQYIEITQQGTYHIRYLPYCGSISLERLSAGGFAQAAREFDKKIAAIPSNLELYYSGQIKQLHTKYLKLPSDIKSLLRASAKLETLYQNVLALESDSSAVLYYMNTESTNHVYTSKEALAQAFFTDFYYYIAAHHGTARLRQQGIHRAEDFVKLATDSHEAYAVDLNTVGFLAGKHLISVEKNGILKNQSEDSFFGFCYQNGLYEELLPFLIRFFAYWRLDEGYANQSNCSADLFAEGWAPTIDIAKFFYYNAETSYVKSARIIDLLTNTAGVVYGFDPADPLPDIRLRGYVFEGWYDNPEYSGNPVTAADLANGKTALYAKWRVDDACQDRDAAGLVDVYIYNLTTLAATRNAATVGYAKEMYDALTANGKQLVTDYPTLQNYIERYCRS